MFPIRNAALAIFRQLGLASIVFAVVSLPLVAQNTGSIRG